MPDYNLTKSAQAVDDTLNLIDESVPKNSDVMTADGTVLLNQTVINASNSGAGSNASLPAGWNSVSYSSFVEAFVDSPTSSGSYGVHIQALNADQATRFLGRDGMYFAGSKELGVWSDYEILTTNNTTVDGSGFIKEASPIVRLFADKADFNNQCPKEAVFEKVSAGHYLIKGTYGFSRNGWYIETPKDANGNIKVYTEYSQLDDNTIQIKTYEPDYSTGKATGGIPVDITSGRWIDLRLEKDTTGE